MNLQIISLIYDFKEFFFFVYTYGEIMQKRYFVSIYAEIGILELGNLRSEAVEKNEFGHLALHTGIMVGAKFFLQSKF